MRIDGPLNSLTIIGQALDLIHSFPLHVHYSVFIHTFLTVLFTAFSFRQDLSLSYHVRLTSFRSVLRTVKVEYRILGFVPHYHTKAGLGPGSKSSKSNVNRKSVVNSHIRFESHF